MIERFENFNAKKARVNLLHAGEGIHIAHCRYTRPSEDEFFMPSAAITYVKQGSKVVFLNGVKHEMTAGQALFIPRHSIIYSDIPVKRNDFISINMVIQDDAAAATDAVLACMAARITAPHGLAELARTHHMSLSTFKRWFQQHMGGSPGRWFIEKRLERARFLLGHKQRSVTAACFESGFNDLSYFIRRYKQHFGDTPGTERN